MNGAQAAVQALERAGCEVAFGIPGGAILPFYDALHDSSIRHVLTRHEQGAAHMADGYARIQRHVGVCIATSGPGATNLATGLATAKADSSPVLAITGQVASEVLGSDAFQEADAFSVLMPVVKHNWRVTDPNAIGAAITEAFGVAASGRFGPVHIDIPLDTQRGEVASPRTANGVRTAVGDTSRLPEAIALMKGAQAPVMLVGGGAQWAPAAPELLQLATALGAPVVTTLMGKGTVPEDHPSVLGVIGMHGKMAATHALNNADLVLAFGTRFSDRSVSTTQDLKRHIIHVDIDPSEADKRVKGVVRLTGDLRDVAQRLSAGLLQGRDLPAWRATVQAWKEACSCDFDLRSDPVKPQRVMHALNEVLPNDAIVTTDVGRHQMWAEHFLSITGDRRFLTSGGMGTMGFGTPAAIGAAFAAPKRATVCITGDGSFQMTCKELATARDHDLPLTIVILNDGLLGMVEQWQRISYKKRFTGVDLGAHPDFVKLGESYGAQAQRVTQAADVPSVLQAAIRSDTLNVIDIAIDPQEPIFPFVPPGRPYQEAMLGNRCTWSAT